ncbi:hypothetical protein, partial [Pseudomonas viridiflava]|uniref:hypothetical protein n=1 Tax=Pseudomonas viridiflava TaxID=33069 RepID=UPI00197E53E7
MKWSSLARTLKSWNFSQSRDHSLPGSSSSGKLRVFQTVLLAGGSDGSLPPVIPFGQYSSLLD